MPLTQKQFLEQRAAVRGTGNPQRVHVPLWEELVRSGETASVAAHRYEAPYSPKDLAGWCFDRFGMTRTRLPDGRIVCIAGEHEDYYDPDFFIYNDVIVLDPAGGIEIYGYAPDAFPPTDFHTATLVGEAIYVIGGLGYRGERGRRSTPIYRLDVRSMRIRPVVAGGDAPGWIFHHRAELTPDGETIRVSGGENITVDDGGKETFSECAAAFSFDTLRERWSTSASDSPTLPSESTGLSLPNWTPSKDQKEAEALRDSIARAVAPDHLLFCGDFRPVWQQNGWPGRVVLQMLDGSGRWAICDSPTYTGREEPPLAVTPFASLTELIDAAGEVDRGEHGTGY